MVDANDFIVRVPSDRAGWTKVHEYSAGGLPWSSLYDAVFLKSKTGAEKSFYVGKGHLAINEDFPEDIVEAAVRETREELGFPQDITLKFNGFHTSYREQRDFEKSKEQSFKTISLLGFTIDSRVNASYDYDGVQVRGLSWHEIEKYAQPKHLDQLIAYQLYLRGL